MTVALCLSCGETKFGALIPCPACQQDPTGNVELDIVFSDHHFTKETLEQLGEVIKELHRRSDDVNKCFWSFIGYVSEHHPEILSVKLEPAMDEAVRELLSRCDLPDVTIERSARG